jgi:hypothetical protein
MLLQFPSRVSLLPLCTSGAKTVRMRDICIPVTLLFLRALKRTGTLASPARSTLAPCALSFVTLGLFLANAHWELRATLVQSQGYVFYSCALSDSRTEVYYCVPPLLAVAHQGSVAAGVAGGGNSLA